MRLTISTAVLACALTLIPAAASAHTETLYDPRNNTALDLKRASIDHTDTKIKGVIATRDNVSNYTLSKRGFFRFHIWEAGKDDVVYAVAIFRTSDGLKARILKIKNKEADGIGMGQARRLAKNEFAFSVSRAKLTFADETHAKWTVLSYWCPTQACDNPREDWLPNTGSEAHFLP